MPNKTDIVKTGEQRYISANALEKFVSDVRRRLPKESRDFFTRDEMILNFQQYVHMQPTIDAVPVVRGEWIQKHHIISLNNMTLAGTYPTCSLCGYAWLGVAKNTNYCPNCGARMESEGGT